ASWEPPYQKWVRLLAAAGIRPRRTHERSHAAGGPRTGGGRHAARVGGRAAASGVNRIVTRGSGTWISAAAIAGSAIGESSRGACGRTPAPPFGALTQNVPP